MDFDDVRWMDLAHIKWRALVLTVINANTMLVKSLNGKRPSWEIIFRWI
jgi:hypothetical protein